MSLLVQLIYWLYFHSYVTSCLILIIVLIVTFNTSRKCTLPGPQGFPIVGYYPFLGKYPYETFKELSKTFGPIFQVQVGSSTSVIISSLEVGREALNNDIAFHGRSENFAIKTFAEVGARTFSFRPASPRWRLLRQTAGKSLGLLGSSKNSKLELVIHKAQDYFESQVDLHLDSPFNPRRLVIDTTAAVIGSILFGIDFDTNNPLVEKLEDTNKIFSDFVNMGGAANNLPFASYLMARQVKTFSDSLIPINLLTETHMANHHYTGTGKQVRDVADALVNVAEHFSPKHLESVGITKSTIRNVSADLFGAGFATTSETVHWMLNLMAANVDVQRRCQREIDLHLGGHSRVQLMDRGQMAYVDACMIEMFRFISLNPLSLPHSMLDDTTFQGYFIPKSAGVYLNLYAIHFDENVFPDPGKLKPERFLRKDGSFDVEKSTKVVPFGLGKRRCVGENLARQEMFMLLVSTLKKYSIQLPPGENIDFSNGDYGFTRLAHIRELVFSKRDAFS